ncbi:hypothetical protein TVAG_310260 [Trichomonas vaginalis G3]|uniref:Surface antigen BspA-like n=1 Tax=Trichomonas vaginalis (strain ATCC PRA-98 / G3) TaxID=412133 RepID=A2EKU2_TRIV3|nr:ribonuclease inhibitor domain-containing protein [Trichomonas vaginalis G3]EAY06739.1 hypothetical protein TVAG_310260 [Trichomonas vaginalis G3]KAI5500969.1 ribonuclease inhibitor domain-containing protein [Trichomonas vaginalis G3]|eukprot:XP_001318962.1 hypothetical protein [Trichomonas vaginalis G3]
MNWTEINKTVVFFEPPSVLPQQSFHKTDCVHFKVFGDVTEISDECFYQYKCLETLELPDSILKIGNSIIAETKIKTIHIPLNCKDLHGFGSFDWTYSLEEFTISPESRYFSVFDGVLYNKLMTKLICYPSARKAHIYTVPYGVKTFMASSTNCISFLKQMIIPQTTSDVFHLLYNCTVPDIKVIIYRFPGASASDLIIGNFSFNSMSNYGRDNLTFITSEYYSEYYEINSSVRLFGLNGKKNIRYTDTFFSLLTTIKTVDVSPSFVSVLTTGFSNSPNAVINIERLSSLRANNCFRSSFVSLLVFISLIK